MAEKTKKDDEKLPENVEKFTKLYDKAHKVASTIDIAHSSAYSKAAGKHLKDEDGNIDYKLLKKSDVQEKFADEMSQHYLEEAKAYFKLDKKDEDMDSLYVDQIMQAYAGLSKSQLMQFLREAGDKYTIDEHNRQLNQFRNETRSQLIYSASNHLSDSDISDLVKYMKADEILDAERMQVRDALQVYNTFHQNKVISREMINYKSPYLKPEPKEEKKKAA